MNSEFAVIGGTGVYDPALLESPEAVRVETPYGSADATIGTYNGKSVVFLPRHGSVHSIPPHKINYRANIYALKKLGVKQVFATAAVGSLQLEFKPGDLIVVDDFLDFTKSRATTFFESNPVVHVDVSDPYCHRLRRELIKTAKAQGMPIHEKGTYVCTEGPRFESPAEIRLYQSWGAAVVGMTSVPEVVLAKEAGLCYATVCMITNYGAGISKTPLTHKEVIERMSKNVHKIRQLFFSTMAAMPVERACRCSDAVASQILLSERGALQ